MQTQKKSRRDLLNLVDKYIVRLDGSIHRVLDFEIGYKKDKKVTLTVRHTVEGLDETRYI